VLSLLLFNLFCPLTKKTKTKNIEQKKKKKERIFWFGGPDSLAITNLTLGGNYCMPQIAYWGLQQQFCQPTPGI
jgi:hypothetical protein